MKKLAVLCLFGLGACSWFQGKDDESEVPKERYVWVQGPVQHPVTGKMCSIGYCKDEPVPEGKSGCHSETYKDKCPYKK